MRPWPAQVGQVVPSVLLEPDASGPGPMPGAPPGGVDDLGRRGSALDSESRLERAPTQRPAEQHAARDCEAAADDAETVARLEPSLPRRAAENIIHLSDTVPRFLFSARILEKKRGRT